MNVGQDTLAEYINGVHPEYKARVNKNGYIRVEKIYSANTLLDTLGGAGWELVAAGGEFANHFYFKRQREGQ